VSQEQVIAYLREIEKLVADCLTAASESDSAKRKTKPSTQPTSTKRRSTQMLDFESSFRFFMNQHAKGMNGQERFALVLAYITKGKLKTEVKLEAIREAWSGMKGLLGKFNTGYATWANDNGWVDSPKPRVYVLLSGWKGILDEDA
jgi:hypothetical protein